MQQGIKSRDTAMCIDANYEGGDTVTKLVGRIQELEVPIKFHGSPGWVFTQITPLSIPHTHT